MNLNDLARVHDDELDGEPAGQVSGAVAQALLASITSEPSGSMTSEPSGRNEKSRIKRLRGPVPWLASAATLAAAVALVAALVAVPDGQEPVPSPVATSPGEQGSARHILLAAATAAAKSPASGSYWRTTTISGMDAVSPDHGYVIRRTGSKDEWLARRHGGQSWWIDQYLGAKPLTRQDQEAWRKAGSPTRWTFPVDTTGYVGVNSGEVVRAGAEEKRATRLRGKWKNSGGSLVKELIGWEEIRRIPSGDRELRAYLERRITAEAKGDYGQDPQWRESALSGACMEIVFGLPVSPAVRASAYRILAGMPRMKSLGRMKDPLGRVGEAIGYQVDPRHEEAPYNVVQIIDPLTGLPLAQSSTTTVKLAGGRTAKATSFVAYQWMGWTDEEPPLPPERD
ncbi:CU044_5270 family protein [Streptosporangium sandarakinum]|uniref:CU044_5270 family protein n=1 Tax=Streptosporangium sandarakinum TaxID=1260955 RepID=UPI0033A4A478